MTVAALILPASAEEALTRIDGRPLVRRLVDAAWAGGAVPVVVAVADPGGEVAAALAGAPATLQPRGDVFDGLEAAVREVSETDAVMLWPSAYGWVDPETLTSLIEAHGVTPAAVLRPTYDGTAGWPVLVPIGAMPSANDRRAGRALEETIADLKAPVRLLDLGDPGTVHDVRTPRTDLAPYRGPARPAGSAHEWGSLAAEEPDAHEEPA
jgi:CTP:molybdopterin cytidylyltransferase MocA